MDRLVQPGLVQDVPAHGRWLEPDDVSRSLPTRDSMIVILLPEYNHRTQPLVPLYHYLTSHEIKKTNKNTTQTTTGQLEATDHKSHKGLQQKSYLVGRKPSQ